MTGPELFVTLGGATAIALLAWVFFGPKQARAARMSGRAQEIAVTVKGGYSPDVIRVRRGVPLRLVFDRQEAGDCTARVVFPDFGVSKTLPAFSRTTLEFTPDRAGEFGFACGMNMLHGTLIVEEGAGEPERDFGAIFLALAGYYLSQFWELARGGYHPTWTADGRAILFHRGLQVFRFDLASGQERLIFDAKQAIPGVTGAGDFELSADGARLAMGIRGPFDGAAVWDFQRRTLIPLTKVQACQTTWAPDGQSLVWVEVGGAGGTRVMTGKADGSGGRVLMDLPGRYSHEYFPKLSNDGRWLIWGAAAEGHEHDRADYEIFLWEVGTPWETAIRLTHYTGNDQWPDIYIPMNSTARHAATGNRGTFR